MKLNSGERIIIPAIIRTLIPSRIISQYMKYCREEGFLPASKRSLYRMIEVSSASMQKSLHGLDNVTAKGTEKKFERPTAERRMEQANFDKESVQLTYSIPFKVTKDIRLAIFQFKIIHHILPTNSTLFRDSLVSKEQCHLCNEKQTLKHLFVTCPFVQTFWTQFFLWWKGKTLNSITLSEQEIIYEFTRDLSRRLGLNLCLIIAQYYIYTVSRREEEYIWEAYSAILKSHLEIEKHKSTLQISL